MRCAEPRLHLCSIVLDARLRVDAFRELDAGSRNAAMHALKDTADTMKPIAQLEQQL